MAIDNAKVDQLIQKGLIDFGATFNAALIVVGDKLGLYKAMAGAGPMTSAELAERARIAVVARAIFQNIMSDLSVRMEVLRTLASRLREIGVASAGNFAARRSRDSKFSRAVRCNIPTST